MYDVAQLASVSGLSVDTIRYYQTQGLLDPPEKQGRRAVYGEKHRHRLERIRDLTDRGFSLKSLRELFGEGGRETTVLRAALEAGSSEAVYQPREFARELGIPYPLLVSLETAGLLVPQPVGDGDQRYTQGDLEAMRGALELLESGVPLHDLLALAVEHDRATRAVVDRAIDLFDDHIRKRTRDGKEESAEKVAEAYRELLPVVTGLVAHHFQRLLVRRALERLERSGQRSSLRTARKAAASTRLRLLWKRA
jgi:DNA-binding transcriptional MerR regulator